MRAALPIAAVVAVLAVAMLWRDGESLEQDSAAATAARSEESRASTSGGVSSAMRTAPVLRAAAVVPAPSAPRAAISADLRQFTQRRNFKDLHDRLSAIPQPTAEQQFILAEIAAQCAGMQQRNRQRDAKAPDPVRAREEFAAAISAKDPTRQARIEAFDRVMQNPCEGLAPAPAFARPLLEAAAAAGDPKAQAKLLQREIFQQARKDGGLPNAGLSESQVASLKQFVAGDDPLAAATALQVLAYPFGNFSLRTGPEESPVDMSAWNAASQLLGCELGSECGRDSLAVLNACAMSGHCVGDMRELLLTYQVSIGSAGRVDEYLQGLRRARSGDWSFFTTVQGPSATAAASRAR